MIEITCDACEKPFEVHASEAGGKVECPMCGDVNKVPLPRAESREKDRGGGREGEAEKELAIVRPAMFRAHPFQYTLLVIGIVAGLGLVFAALTQENVPTWSAWGGLVITLFFGGWFGNWWLASHWWRKLVVTNKRTIRHEGIIRRHTTEVLHDHVRSVDIEQGFLHRILRVGTIGISSASQGDIEINMRHIPDPYDVKALIDKYRDGLSSID